MLSYKLLAFHPKQHFTYFAYLHDLYTSLNLRDFSH